MLSMPYDVYSELFDAVDGLGVEIENLQAENAKLREYIERKKGLQDFARLVDENSKLRELVREMRVCLEDECKRCHEWGDICDLEQCMRELGIEVDE